MSVRARTTDEQGMTLVEVMVALVIVGLVLSALASSLATSLRAVRGQEAQTQATAAINDILEETQRVDYADAVLCTAKAQATFGVDLTFEGEDMVVATGVCDTTDEVLPERTVTRDGRDYAVTTAITWADDPGDGTGAGDADTTQDIKRVVVQVDWTADGRARTARNLAYRAPQFLEQLVTGEVEADDGSAFITITDDAADDGENAEAFTLRAVAREKLSSAQVSWVDRNGATETHPMTAVNSDGLVWEFNLHSNFGPFANGGTLFEFEGTSTAGETEVVSGRGLFLYDPLLTIGSPAIQSNFTKLQVSSTDGLVCPGQWMEMDVEGAIRSDLATATWVQGPAGEYSLTSVDAPDAIALRGARFRLDLSGRDEFATYDSTSGAYAPVSSGIVQVRVRVDRIVDGAFIAKELSNINLEMVPSC